jgi:acetylornithine deacetylase/succinyl-diaminopimelate desuccinylase-like protein
MPPTADRALAWLHENESASVQRLIDWLKIASISTDPQYAVECKRAARWAADQLEGAGLTAQVLPTGTPDKPGHPVVLAHSPGSTDYRGPHILFYGHYDVQPVDPLDLWESPPFEPVIREGTPGGPGRRIVARGAVDDKGQVMCFIEALHAFKQTSDVPAGGVKFTVLLEGEEESGSVHLDDFIRANKTALKDCDVCLISDTGMLARGKPAITYGVRGLAYTEITLIGPDQDLHSGLWGGRVLNPNLALAKVLSQLHDEHNRVTIPGFYQGVPDVHPSEQKAWNSLGLSSAPSSASGRAPPPRSTACGAATPAPAPRPSSPRAPAPRSASDWWPTRTQPRSPRCSSPGCTSARPPASAGSCMTCTAGTPPRCRSTACTCRPPCAPCAAPRPASSPR